MASDSIEIGARTFPGRRWPCACEFSDKAAKFGAAADGDGPRCDWLAIVLVGLIVLVAAEVMAAAESKNTNTLAGLAVTFTAHEGGAIDKAVLPNIWLYVPAGQPPTPFLPGGKFTALWNGFVASDLRSEYRFQAEVSGGLKVEINGAVALEFTGQGEASPLSQPVKLNKGANAIRVTFARPPKGDAWVRLAWTERGTNTTPLPSPALSYAVTREMELAYQLRWGRELMLEHRCIKCHGDAAMKNGLPELGMDAPNLQGIGARRNFSWLAKWILDPKAMRPSARMPKLLRGDAAKGEAEAMAAYLASLQAKAVGQSETSGIAALNGGPISPAKAAEVRPSKANLEQPQGNPPSDAGAAEKGEHQNLFETLHCAACHDAPEGKGVDPAKLSLKHVAEKFPPGQLAEFLRKPEAFYAWIRMPNFKLTTHEAGELAEALLRHADPPKISPAPTDEGLIERGQKLVQTSGCLNCHALNLENRFQAPPLGALHTRHLKDRSKIPLGDCLGPTPRADFGFKPEEKAALEEFTVKGFDSLTRHVSAEFAERQALLLNCRNCHGPLEGFPPFDILGGKLKPEWSAKFIAGEISYKPRAEFHPAGDAWLPARMPAFASRARWLAEGLAMQHGHPPQTPAEGPIDLEAAKIGEQLVGKEGGFACVACHAVGSVKAVAVFESEGTNLAHAAERLLRSYFFQWTRNPLAIDPQTKMPMYFDEGRSPLTEIYGGNADQQIDALWQYMRLGDKMPAPKTD
jgi:mono/diheme cytochrome c family protein